MWLLYGSDNKRRRCYSVCVHDPILICKDANMQCVALNIHDKKLGIVRYLYQKMEVPWFHFEEIN